MQAMATQLGGWHMLDLRLCDNFVQCRLAQIEENQD